eukprot:2063033-Alexandrium_andersonii.AAC.1
MLRLFLGPRSSRFERREGAQHAQLPLALLGSIGSVRYSSRSVLGLRAIEHLLAVPDQGLNICPLAGGTLECPSQG